MGSVCIRLLGRGTGARPDIVPAAEEWSLDGTELSMSSHSTVHSCDSTVSLSSSCTESETAFLTAVYVDAVASVLSEC